MDEARRSWMKAAAHERLFPVLDLEFWLLGALMIGDLELEILRADALLEADVGRASIITLVRLFAVEQRDELVLARLEVADIQALHAALEQRRHLTRGIQVARDIAVVDLERD